mgnify:CR=1 FL=1
MESEIFNLDESNKVGEPKTLLEINVNNESMALKIMVNYLTNAQKAGLFGFRESSKIWDALQQFANKTKDLSIDKTVVDNTHLLDIKVNNIQDALQVVFGFMNILQKKGVFSLEESSKVLSCINIFKNN